MKTRQLLNYSNTIGDADWEEAAVKYWLNNDSQGNSIHILTWGHGWVCQIQESFLTKKGQFEHKNDIPSFEYSHYLVIGDGTWPHIFKTKEAALECYTKHHGPKIEKLFYIQDTSNYVGNAVLWWGIKSAGYTTEIKKAGKYTKEEAILICKRKTDLAWPCKYIHQQNVARFIDSQYLDRSQAKAWRGRGK